jgi:hypothetical protein
MGGDKMKINLNLDNYPHMKKIAEEDTTAFSFYLKSIMQLAETALVQGYDKTSVNEFQIPYASLLLEVSEAFFDYKGILKHHHKPREAKMLEVLQHENNPLISKNFYRIEDGEQVTKEEFFGGKLKVKDWLQSMLYAGRYLSHADLVRYLTLNEYALVERMQNDNIAELVRIQPALNYQKGHDLIVGKLLKGTSFFDCGYIKVLNANRDKCRLCLSDNFFDYEEYRLCNDCKAATQIIELERV